MNMSWLKKVGEIAGKTAVAVTGAERFLPILKSFLPAGAQDEIQAIEDTLPKIASAIEKAEIIGAALSLPGAQKLTAATPLVAQELLHSPLFKGRKPKNEALFMQGASKMADGMADILNSFDESEVKTGGQS